MTKHKVRKLNMENRIKELRKEKGLTLEKLSERVGIAKNTLSRYESRDREPKLKVWQKLADYFDVSVPYLQGFDKQTPNRLKELRIKKKLTLDDIEAKTGIKRGTYSNYENGNTEPKLEVWQELARFFKVSVPYLQGFDEHKSNRLKELRQHENISQGDLAKATGLTRQAISNYERGNRDPNRETWQQLANYFEVSVSYLKNEIDTEYLEKLVELLMLLSFPKIVISYGDTDIDDDTKPFISVEIMSQICKLLGYDSKDEFLKIYKKVMKLVDDTETVEYLQQFKSVIIQLMPKAKGVTENLLNAYDNL